MCFQFSEVVSGKQHPSISDVHEGGQKWPFGDGPRQRLLLRGRGHPGHDREQNGHSAKTYSKIGEFLYDHMSHHCGVGTCSKVSRMVLFVQAGYSTFLASSLTLPLRTDAFNSRKLLSVRLMYFSSKERCHSVRTFFGDKGPGLYREVVVEWSTVPSDNGWDGLWPQYTWAAGYRKSG